MSVRVYSDTDRILPRALVTVLVGLVLATIAFAAFARLTDRPLTNSIPEAEVAQEVQVALRSNAASGAVTVRDLHGEVITEFGQEGGGFISTIHRVILRQRSIAGAAPDAPIHIQAFANGRIGVFDPETGQRIDLMAYGPDNIAVFANLITTTETHTDGGRTDGTADERS